MKPTIIKYKCINLFLILFTVLTSTVSSASYVNYNTVTTEITSVPYNTSGYGVSDGGGNSISVTRSVNVPVIVSQYPNAVWVPMDNAKVPPNAIILQYVNGYPAYYCRVQIDGRLYYGQLFPNDGCYVDGFSEKPFTSYQTLVR